METVSKNGNSINDQHKVALDTKIHRAIREIIYSPDFTPERLRDFYSSNAEAFEEV